MSLWVGERDCGVVCLDVSSLSCRVDPQLALSELTLAVSVSLF